MYRKLKLKASVGRRQIYRRVAGAVNDSLHEIQNEILVRDVSLSFSNSNSTLRSSPATICNNNPIVNDENHFKESYPSEVIIQADVHSDSSNHMSVNTNHADSDTTISEEHRSPARDLKLNLRHWAINNKISHTAITQLLHILSPLALGLPKDSRTLLQTPSRTIVKQLDTGMYCHLGLHDVITRLISFNQKILGNTVRLSFNVDGLPLFHSSNLQFWPILGLIKNFKSGPFVVGIFSGHSKPEPLESYLEDFVNELIILQTNGLTVGQKKYNIEVHSFVCDAPARAYIKRVKSHGGYSSCEKCVEHGDYINGRVVMLGMSATKRTDDSFLQQTDEEHHLGVSPLVKLGVGLVSRFPVDYMHCVCLGVMRKLLNSWIGGPVPLKLCSSSVSLLSEKLISLKKYISSEFNRKPRTLSELQRWKATEFRSFLLYLGPVVLINVVDPSIYEHFLLLHCGITILISDRHINTLGFELANELLTAFVGHCRQIYGSDYFVYNIHMLLHLSDDCRMYGALDEFSAFPFESFLGQLKHLIKSPTNPLAQVHRRLVEMNKISVEEALLGRNMVLDQEHFSGPLIGNSLHKTQYKKLVLMDVALTVNSHSVADCYCLLRDRIVVQIHNIILDKNNEICLIGRRFMSYSSFFSYPFDSRKLDIFVIESLSTENDMWLLKEVVCKCLVLPFKGNTCWVSFPILHTCVK